MKEIKITKVTIEIGNKSIELSLDELRQLRDEIDRALPRKTVEYVPTYVPTWPVYKPTVPYWRTSPNYTLDCNTST